MSRSKNSFRVTWRQRTRAGERHPPTVLVLLSLWLMVFASSSQVMIVAPILPRIGEALNVPETLQGTLITGYAIALSIFAVIIGPISDRFGRRPILLTGTGWLMVALLAHAFTNDFVSLLLVRILAGMAGGILTGSAVAYVGDYFPYERRGWAAGWVMSGFSFGQVVGVPIGTLSASQYGFRIPFLLFAGVAAGAFLLIFTIVPKPQVERTQGLLSLGAALKGYQALLHQPAVVSAALAYATMFFAVSTFVVFFPTWAEQTLNMDAMAVALLFVIGGIASILFGPQAGRWSDRVGRKPLIIGSCFASAVLFGATPFIVSTPLFAYAVFFLVMTLLALRLSPLQALLTALVPSHRRGSLLSLVVAIGQVGGGIGGAVAGVTYTQFGYIGSTTLSAVAIAVAGAVVWWGLPEPLRE